MTNANKPKPQSRIERELILEWWCGVSLKQVMARHEIDNIMLAQLAGVDSSYVSRARNGVLALRNYVLVIRGLPESARAEYLQKVYYDTIPETMPIEILNKIADRAHKSKRRQAAIDN